jgi:hypothetical protein
MARDFWRQEFESQRVAGIRMSATVLLGPRESTDVLETWWRRRRSPLHFKHGGREPGAAVRPKKTAKTVQFESQVHSQLTLHWAGPHGLRRIAEWARIPRPAIRTFPANSRTRDPARNQTKATAPTGRRRGTPVTTRRTSRPSWPRPSSPHGSGLGTSRWVVERTLEWLHRFRRLALRYERRADVHE